MSEGRVIVGIEAIVGGEEGSGGLADGLHLSLRHATDAREADGGVVARARRAGGAVGVVHGVGGGKVTRDVWLWIHLFSFLLFFSFRDPPRKVVWWEAAERAGAGERPADQQNQARSDFRKGSKAVVHLNDSGEGGREKRAEGGGGGGGGGGFGRKDTDTDWTETGR